MGDLLKSAQKRVLLFSTALNVFAEELRQSVSFPPSFDFAVGGVGTFIVIHGGYRSRKLQKSISSEKTKTLVEATVKLDNLLIYLLKGLQFHFEAGEGILNEPRK